MLPFTQRASWQPTRRADAEALRRRSYFGALRRCCRHHALLRPAAAQLAVSRSACAAAAAAAAAFLLQPECAVAALHAEPVNALSLPTWAIHTASVGEWLVAMDLVWTFGERTGRSAWKGLAWGMLPLHASSLCAVVYHLFYNAPALNALVTLQAASTCFGNFTLLAAAARIAMLRGVVPVRCVAELSGSEKHSDAEFLGRALAASVVSAAAIKYGSLLADPLFEPSLPLALAIIGTGTALTGIALAVRSSSEQR